MPLPCGRLLSKGMYLGPVKLSDSANHLRIEFKLTLLAQKVSVFNDSQGPISTAARRWPQED